ncbi:M14 family metallopeptidase [Urechidicola sp. KH5]
MKKHTFLSFLLFISIQLLAQNIQSPSQFLGYELGTQFSRHHEVVSYYKYLESQVENLQLQQYGTTNERRGLYLAILSSNQNMQQLETIRLDNLKRTGMVEGTASTNIPIVWLSYNVHGNESSSTEASMQTIYELLTSKKNLLENAVVIIDPCINPDGRDRYVNWYNQVKSSPYNKSQDAREHSEPWPSGRPNHYLFDLNRDWAWATQVETQQRLEVYNKWMPHVHVDFHEQGINSPYYFAPAVEPYHEIITDWQREFQTHVGKNNAKYFDKNGWLYFTKESFDLLYPSYGDTYPTYMGTIGMTYEQAGHGRAGLGIQTDEGFELTLKDRIAHHTTSGLSTVETSVTHASQLLSEFENYFVNKNLNYKSYILKNDNPDKIEKLKALLERHGIVYGAPTSSKVSGYHYATQSEGTLNLDKNDIVISTDQPLGKMVKVLFEPQTKLSDSLTYDITAWSIPYAYGLDAIASKTNVKTEVSVAPTFVSNTTHTNAIGYVFKYRSVADAAFLGAVLQHDLFVRRAEKSFSVDGTNFKAGSLLVLKSDNSPDYQEKIVTLANEHKQALTPVTTGFVNSGPDFGSYSMAPVNKQRVAVLAGNSVSSLAFGEVWYFFEQELKYPLTVIDADDLGYAEMTDYDVLILPNGYYGSVLDEDTMNSLNSWVRSGGTLIALENALSSFANKDGGALKTKKDDNDKSKEADLTPYSDLERKNAENLITGAIYKTKVDASHPLAFGYNGTYYTLKARKTSYDYLQKGGNVAYTDSSATPISGFAGTKAKEMQQKALLFGVERKGSGAMVYMVDNPLFRAFWENGKLFIANAVFQFNSEELR